ncbi:hypothetical protein PINS_up003933 [Pythium insidiosum]|nr:hypothetical protein PINS_up003933 [Pythium insidiosum]
MPIDASGIRIPVLHADALVGRWCPLVDFKAIFLTGFLDTEATLNGAEFQQLAKLCSLDISFNRLTSLRNLHTARELRELKAYNNKITTTKGLKANGILETVLLQENQIESISEDFLGLPKLKTLWLNGNRISAVQHLTACRLLVHLDLSRNRLRGSVAEGLESLSSLEYLNLSGNELSSIGNIAHLTKLEELNIANNKFATLEGSSRK